MQKLPEATQSKLRSTQILTSLPQLVSELVQNSLDAGTSQVDIGIDCEGWGCWVRDNGVGISKDGLCSLAGDSQPVRYSTSKAYTPASLDEVKTFGFRGEALASAADLSCLEIASRTSRSRESWSIICKGGATLYNGPSIRWRRESAGTVVCVRDAYYNLPIRRLAHPSPARTAQIIRKDVETFALVFPHVSFTLEDTSKANEINAIKGRIMTIPKTSSTLSCFRHLYGRALAEHVDEIDDTCGGMKLQGFISLEGASTKGYQYFYINRHPIAPSNLHRLIDRIFSTSTFIKHAYDETGEMNRPFSAVRRSPRKSEKKPVYVLNLTISPQEIDNCLEPAKAAVHLQNSAAVSAFLSSVVESFLSRRGFIQRSTQHRSGSLSLSCSPSPRKRRKLIQIDDPQLASLTSHVQEPSSTLFSRQVFKPCQSYPPQMVSNNSLIIGESLDEVDDETEILWTDAATGQTYVVDKRTGNSHPQGIPDVNVDENENNTVTTSHGRRRLVNSSGRVGKIPVGDTPEWIKKALSANEAYTLLEAKIPSLSTSDAFTTGMIQEQRKCLNHERRGRASHHHNPQLENPTTTSSAPRLHHFQKSDLRNAKVLGQVDKKFVACLIEVALDTEQDSDGNTMKRDNVSGGGKTLVLIDQHAADERIRVERFFKDICHQYLRHPETSGSSNKYCGSQRDIGVRTRELTPPVPILLTCEEGERLARDDVIQEAFARWGFTFVDLQIIIQQRNVIVVHEDRAEDPEKTRAAYVQINTKTVPEIVADKLLADDELRDAIKSFLAQLELEGPAIFPHNLGDTLSDTDNEWPALWLKAMRYCPKVLIELINSKACRGAIMFNDSLSLLQCDKMIQQLSETTFPFQCAHGRPSLVPLAEVGRSYDLAVSKKGRPVDWTIYMKGR